MASIPYLSGGENATAGRMNALFNELERKLELLLHGRSFLLAFPGGCPPNLLGKQFAFVGTDKPQQYAWRALVGVQGAFTGGGADIVSHDPNTGFPLAEPIVNPVSFPAVVRPYNHAQFTAVTPVVELVDEVNHIMRISPIPGGAYQGLPNVQGIGFFEHSLSVHKKTGTGQGGLTGQAGVTYFLRERHILALCAPEKFYDWAVAEILIEGVNSVTLPGDKYCFFRIHNLNSTSATVSFSAPGQAYSFTLSPFECRTIRRDRTVTNGNATFSNYRSSGRYFWQFEAGDPRFFWGFGSSNKAAMRSSYTGNNIVNPAIAWDWLSALDNPQINAWWKRDKHTHADARRFDAQGQQIWGDPSNPATKLGDLIHHQGKIRIARIHKSQKQPPPNQALPRLEWDEVEFRGYSTIVADFAAKGLIVRERSDGNLEVTANDANWIIDLIPVGTNLFKPWVAGDATVATGTGVDTVPTVCLDIEANPRPIESAIFEAQSIPLGNFSTSAPELVIPRSVTSTPNVRYWRRRMGEPPDINGYPLTEQVEVVGDPVETLIYPPGRTPQNPAKVMSGIHKVTVADLLKLDWWGNKQLESQDNAYTTHANKQLRLTPEGLVLTYTEQVKATPLPSGLSNNTYTGPDGSKFDLTGDPGTGFFNIKRVIRFRGHGWPYGTTGQETTGFQLSTGGAAFSAFFPAGHSRAQVQPVIGALVNKDGKDFELQNLQPIENEVKAMRRIRPQNLRDDGQLWTLDGRNAGFSGNLDGLSRFEINRLTQGGNWYIGPPSPPAAFPFSTRFGLVSSPQSTPGTGAMLAMVLHADHYNGLAAAINAIQQGSPLTYRSAAWWVPSKSKYVGFTPGGWVFNFAAVPIPINGFAKFDAGGDQDALMQQLGVPVLGENDLPDNFATVRESFNTRQEIEGVTTVTGSYPAGITVEIEFEEGDSFDEAKGYAFMPRTTVDPPLYGSHLTFPPPAPPATIQQYPTNTLNLAGAYGGLRWTAIESVKAAVEAAGLKFVWIEAFEPLKLEVINKPTGFEEVEGSDKTVGPVTDFPFKSNGSPGTPRPRVKFSRMTKQIIFRLSENSEEVKWKRPIGGQVTIHNTTIRDASIPEFANMWGLWSIKFVQASPDIHVNGAYAYINQDRIPKEEGGSDTIHGQWVKGGALAIEWPVDDEYKRWARWALDEERMIALQIVNSSGVTSRNEVYLSPTSTWTGQKDWWTESLDGYFLPFTFGYNFMITLTPQVFAPANPARKVTCGPGITLVRAEEDSRYVCLFDIRNNLINLA